jgi:hypothetical protein
MFLMNTRASVLAALIGLAACDSTDPLMPPASTIELVSGNDQLGVVGTTLADPLMVQVTDAGGNPVQDVVVSWIVVDGGGSITSSSVTGVDGTAGANFTLGPTAGEQHVQAQVNGLSGSPVVFTATATLASGFAVVAGGNNVSERYSSDLWVHGHYAYTGTWGSRGGRVGNVLNVWSLGSSGNPTFVRSVAVPSIGTVSDVQVSDDGQILVLSGERGTNGGIYLYQLTDPSNPSPISSALVGAAGVHTVTLTEIGGRQYAFAARNPGALDPALLIYDITDPATPRLVATEPYPERDYGIHDTFVRDGIAFAFVWNSPGVVIYDVGQGIAGGTPENPVELSRVITSANGSSGGPSVHNGWWFHNPVSGEHRYLFVGQEGPSIIGSSSSGDIHVVDVSDLSHPTEVAFYHMNGAGTHNFWMDEARQILYAAYYNGGVIALDVSGTLNGNLSNRLLSQVRPGGPRNTFTWGVQLANGYLYAVDMLSGLWQLTTE